MAMYSKLQSIIMDLRLSGNTRRAENGRYPTISVNNDGTVVEMHQIGWFNYSLHYSVGVLGSNDINWGSDISLDDWGVYADIAVNDNDDVVEVHQSEGLRRNMWYRAGKVDVRSKTIDWALGNSEFIGKGRYSVVALSNEGKVVVAHQSTYGSETYFWIGNLNSEDHTITFTGDSAQLFRVRNGVSELSIAINGLGWLIAAGQGADHNLVYKVGQLIGLNDERSEIRWQNEESANMDSIYPSIGLDDKGHVISVQQSKSSTRITYRVGKIESEGNKLKRVTWSCDEKEYESGCVPVIAVSNDGKKIVEEHEENDGKTFVYCICNLN